MKKFFSFLVAAAMLFTTSCSNDDLGEDGEAFVSFALNLDGVTSTKADPVIGKGTKVNTLLYSIYELKKDQDGKVITTYLSTVPAKTVTFPATEVIRLAKNKDYKVVFWAQSSECGAYNVDPETMEVSISYDGYNNDENRDAFFKAIEVPHVTGSVEVDVEMKRPFAQLNVGVIKEDWDAAEISHAKVLNSQVTISEVAEKINLLTGEVEAAAQPITFKMAAIPSEMLMVDVNNDGEKEPFYYLSMSYLLVNDQNTENGSGPANVAVDFVFETESNQISLNVPTVSVQRNYRTNILGQILTGNVTFDVYIDAEFAGNQNIDITPKEDIVLKNDYAEVYNIEGLMKWCYIVNNEEGKLGYGMKLMDNIILPAKTIELDAANKTYKFTTTDITVTDGVPSGSNWMPVGSNISDYDEAYSGHIDGQNFKIKGIRVAQSSSNFVGFVGYLWDDASIKNLVFEDAVVCGATNTGIAAGRAQNGTFVENVHVINSSVVGTESVGGIVGYNYRRVGGANGQGFQELMSYVKNCTTDKNTKVVGNGDNVGGICGKNYGAVIIYCVNNADVEGKNYVGGVVGYTRDYHYDADCYVIACGSTAEASISGTKSVGGVAGYAMTDNGHRNTAGYIVACYSMSSVSGNTSAAILGSSSHSTVFASVGVMNGTSKACDSDCTVNGVFAYDNAANATQADVDAMNQAIATYNAISGIEQTCPYTWEWTNGSLPVLK